VNENEVRPSCLKIGVVAYEFVPDTLVFARVPNEPGRWVLTHKCVALVACPVCKAIAGEPCFRPYNRSATYKERKYWAGTHCDRKTRARLIKDRPKVRVTADDLAPADLEETA